MLLKNESAASSAPPAEAYISPPPSPQPYSPPPPTWTATMQPVKLAGVDEHGLIQVTDEGIEMFKLLRAPVRVLTVAGVAREGKSTFLSLLMRHIDRHIDSSEQHFGVSQGTKSCTAGCWAYSTELPGIEGSLVLMDTQGLACGEESGTARLFVLSTLISSLVVLNVMRQVNDDTLDKLGAMAALTRLVPAADARVFPALHILVRDFDLIPDGTLDDYLAEWLELDGTPRDSIRETITSTFKTRRLHAMETPTKEEKQFLNSLHERPGLPPHGEFRESFEQTAQCVLQAIQAKKIGPAIASGLDLVRFIQQVVPAINNSVVDYDRAADAIIGAKLAGELSVAATPVEDEMATIELPLRPEELKHLTTQLINQARVQLELRLAECGLLHNDDRANECIQKLMLQLDQHQGRIMNDNIRALQAQQVEEQSNQIRHMTDTHTCLATEVQSIKTMNSRLANEIETLRTLQTHVTRHVTNRHYEDDYDECRDCSNRAASDCDYGRCGRCCNGCSRHIKHHVTHHHYDECRDCSNRVASDCDYGRCGRCCRGCSRH